MKHPTTKTLSPGPRQLGSVSADELLPMREFGRRLDLADKCLSDAQKQGLRVIKFGRQKFVLGFDALTFFSKLADEQSGQNGGGSDA